MTGDEPVVSYTTNQSSIRIPGTGGVQIFRLETVGQYWTTSSIQLMAPLCLRNSLNIPVGGDLKNSDLQTRAHLSSSSLI